MDLSRITIETIAEFENLVFDIDKDDNFNKIKEIFSYFDIYWVQFLLITAGELNFFSFPKFAEILRLTGEN